MENKNIDNSNGRLRDERISYIRESVLENKSNIGIVAKELIALQIEVARLAERMALFQIAQGVFTVIATAIAVYMSYVIK